MSLFTGRAELGSRDAIRNGRKRRPISCLLCRTRKLKCDHALPVCGNCVNRGDITACRYVPRKNDARTMPPDPSVLSDAVQARIDDLEHLVRTFIENHQHTTVQTDTLPDSTHSSTNPNHTKSLLVDNGHGSHPGASGPALKQLTANLTNSRTTLSIDADYKQSSSVDQAHWALLLNEIGDVRAYLDGKRRQYETQTKKTSNLLQQSSADPGPSLLFGSSKTINRSEILSQLPSKYSCDILVTRFFAHLYPPLHILHESTFYKQYENFWEDESNMSNAWIGMLFGILRIATLDYLREGDEPAEYKGKCQDLAVTFRNRFTDCLILADYTLPQEFLIEALILHLYGEYVASRDAKSAIWVLVGMIVRLAMRMGYHQPVQPTLRATPFHAEMRRRAWTFIQQSDILISFQMGLPSMIGLSSLEPSLPRNIHDDENFNEECTALPPSLPDSVPTQISYLIAKAKLAFGFARALHEVNRTDVPRWERVLEIDRELRKIYSNVPDHYKLGELSDQDSLVLVSARFVLSSIHHKSLCVIHSRYLETARSDNRFLYSRHVCLTSAMSILRFQAIQDQKIPVNGQVRSLTNYQTSLAIHDYLLAATIITADLSSDNGLAETSNSRVSSGIPNRMEMIKALRTAAEIFGQSQNQSMEAYKAADVLQMIVKNFESRCRNGGRHVKTQQRISKANELTPKSSSSHEQTSPHAVSIATNTGSPTSLFPRASSEVTLSGRFQGTMPTPPSPSQNSRPDERTSGRSEQTEMSNLDAFTAWPEPVRNGFGTRINPTQQHLPEFEPSEMWNMSEDPGDLTDPTFDNVAFSNGSSQNTLPYSTTFALSDPMASLWNMYSATQEGFGMDRF